MPGLQIKVTEYSDFAISTLKLVTMATHLEPLEKGGQIDNLQSNTYHIKEKKRKGSVFI